MSADHADSAGEKGMTPVVVALGGNALIRDQAHLSIPDQYEAVCAIASQLVDLSEAGHPLVVTHGNGPQVGFILRRSEMSISEVAPVPLDYAVGDTQGAIGHMFLLALRNELRKRGSRRSVAALVTQALVDTSDPAFGNPTKFVGAVLDELTARARAATLGWTVAEDPPLGWRRTVVSPEPKAILELDTIRCLLAESVIVVACGGGGIAVAADDRGALVGVEAVIDKDLASALLADELGAGLLVIPTAVDRVAIGYGTPDQRWLDRLTVDEARAWRDAGQFGVGSMRPKIDAIIGFVTGGADRVGIITSAARLSDAIAGAAGTRIVG